MKVHGAKWEGKGSGEDTGDIGQGPNPLGMVPAVCQLASIHIQKSISHEIYTDY